MLHLSSQGPHSAWPQGLRKPQPWAWGARQTPGDGPSGGTGPSGEDRTIRRGRDCGGLGHGGGAGLGGDGAVADWATVGGRDHCTQLLPSLSASAPAVLRDRHRSLARARQMSKSSGRKASVSLGAMHASVTQDTEGLLLRPGRCPSLLTALAAHAPHTVLGSALCPTMTSWLGGDAHGTHTGKDKDTWPGPRAPGNPTAHTSVTSMSKDTA